MADAPGIHDIRLADVDVGGDVHRVVLGGIPVPPDLSAFEVRDHVSRHADVIRQILMSYPYGNEDMCANLVFESKRDDAPYAHITMECMGYPHFSGSNCAATIAALLEFGLVPMQDGVGTVLHEVPTGLIEATYRAEGGTVRDITIEGADSYVIEDQRRVDLPGHGPVDVALVWSGTGYVMVDADTLGIAIDADHVERMKRFGRALCDAVEPGFRHRHPVLGPVEAPKFVAFMGPCRKSGDRRYEGSGAVYGYPATVFRCPTGTGTAARMALAAGRGAMEPDAVLRNIAPGGSTFTGHGLGWRDRNGTTMLGVAIESRPYILATTTMHVDFENPSMTPFADLLRLLQP